MFNYSSAAGFGSVGYTGRRAADAVGTVDPADPLAEGVDEYVLLDAQQRNRFGDYTGIALDPTGKSDFYAYGEFAGARQGTTGVPASGVWGTSWGAFSMRQFGKADDFNGDGYGDLILQYISSTASTHLRLWAMEEESRIYTAKFNPSYMSAGVYAYATGDFDLNGRPDLIHRTAANSRIGLWLMNGVQRVKSLWTYTTPARTTIATSSAVPIGSGDLNQDGYTDLFLSSGTTVTCWYMEPPNSTLGPARLGSATFTLPATNGLVGVADVNADGLPDLIAQNTSTSTTNPNRGNVTVHLLNAGAVGVTTISSSGSRSMSPQILSTTEDVVSLSDLNGDDLNDIVSRVGANVYVRYRQLAPGETAQTATGFEVSAQTQLRQNVPGSPPPAATLPSGYSIRN